MVVKVLLVTGVHENVDIHGSTYVIFGGGVAATNAANVALGLNAKVIIIELNDDRIKYLQDMYAEKRCHSSQINTRKFSRTN